MGCELTWEKHGSDEWHCDCHGMRIAAAPNRWWVCRRIGRLLDVMFRGAADDLKQAKERAESVACRFSELGDYVQEQEGEMFL